MATKFPFPPAKKTAPGGKGKAPPFGKKPAGKMPPKSGGKGC